MKRYIMSITARDRTGIVAGVSEAVLELEGNIEAASQTVHQGYFAMMLLCAFPKETDKEQVKKSMHQRAGGDLHVFVTDYIAPAPAGGAASQTFIMTALGPDKPGILHALSAYLSSRNCNVDDLYCRVEGSDFVVICQVSVPVDQDYFMLQADLEAAGEELGMTVNMQHENIFTATNQLRFEHAK